MEYEVNHINDVLQFKLEVQPEDFINVGLEVTSICPYESAEVPEARGEDLSTRRRRN